ncbi:MULTISPECIES: 4-(cytidine 5'-diphospho)-2-C-methyl-D-erythritol kinase [unclassified Sphingopyxis]|uniref:4-(cytidine 5'-diphospho)-2-C-methyl-D-erythritol kinase n=1 Tax=unclassified Sphingopyxis TaxID=2614943 RepID=UPI000736A240|nr:MULTISPECIES: 4-(cytidine 5'-diphospho)-2-C-methyl-D-erythritol kinase [unclassified Sphingopyxis]KTE34902.1 4-diphosphocytidyl-2C-methyl-D-erythritol kinase [Sphingopyxis sp. HIX]KTE82287.1 4-diphosphocytidyl-2C-methyl-D-erythritol kinase [Sphingopyxis sp. HXXIV]
MTMLAETGWAKINLALHVRARRADGYHEIETLFAFVDHGDTIEARVAAVDALAIDGEFAEGLSAGADNLVLRAVALLRERYGADRVPPLAVRLTKRLPVAAGIGGGSADAAAMARLVRTHFLPELGDAVLARIVAPLGADVAACVASRTCLGVGVGEELTPLPELRLGGTPVLLVNPRQPVATGPVFAAWDGIDRGPLYGDPAGRAKLLAARNDLQRPAVAQCPAIADILLELGALGPWLARMSGSGATCFALFDALAERDAASVKLADGHPHWWQMAGTLR